MQFQVLLVVYISFIHTYDQRMDLINKIKVRETQNKIKVNLFLKYVYFKDFLDLFIFFILFLSKLKQINVFLLPLFPITIQSYFISFFYKVIKFQIFQSSNILLFIYFPEFRNQYLFTYKLSVYLFLIYYFISIFILVIIKMFLKIV